MPNAGSIVIQDDTIIEAHDLALKRERNDEWYVGREDLGQFVALPELWAQAIIFMSVKNAFTGSYPTFAAVKAFIRAKSRGEDEFHAELDRELRLFMSQLVRHRLIRSIGGVVVEEAGQKRDLLPSIQRRHVAWCFSPIALAIQGCVILVGLGLMSMNPVLRPHLMDYFWSPYVGLTVLSAFVAAWFLTLQHELFRVLSARSRSLSGTLSFSTRGLSLIMEANIHNLPKTHPAWVRRMVYASGIVADLLVVSLGTFALFGQLQGTLLWPLWAIGIIRQVILLRLLGILWQGVLYFRTDVASIIQDIAGDPNLYRKSRSYLAEVWHMIRHPIPKDVPVHRDQRTWPIASRAVKRFSYAMLAASLACGSILFVLKVRILVELVRRTGIELSAGLHGDPWMLLDGTLVLTLLGIMLTLNIRSRLRSRP